ADNGGCVQRRIDDHGRDSGSRCLFYRADEGVAVKRREHDAADALADEGFNHLRLLFTIILTEWSFPADIDFSAFRLEVTGGFGRTGMNALPVFVRRALRDHRYGIALD